MPTWTCPTCDKPRKRAFCSACGTSAPSSALVIAPSDRMAGPVPTAPKRCRFDNTELMPDGFCLTGGGYPLGRTCPLVCPLCRGPLDWSGGCEQCHGCTTARREDWTFPGDRYDCFDDEGAAIGDGQHWVKTDGPRPAVTAAQNAAGLRAVRHILAKSTIANLKPPAQP